MRRSQRAYAALAGEARQRAGRRTKPFVERAINANYRLGTRRQCARRWRNTPRATAPTAAMRAEALLQLGLWGKTPQRDRVVGIYRPLAPRDGKPAADALTAVLPKVLGKATGSRAARGARSHRQPAAARTRADAAGDRGQRAGAGSRARRRAQGARHLRRR